MNLAISVQNVVVLRSMAGPPPRY